MKDLDLGSIQSGEASGLDAFLASEPRIVSPVQASATPPKTGSVRVASLQQLDGFRRISAETLVHKSTNDLWTIKADGKDFVIERLFQDNGTPLKG